MLRTLSAFLTLIRWPNLVFIALTQILVYYKIVKPAVLQKGLEPLLNETYLFWLCLSTALIAAAGYMINDYFDIGIDNVNKPDKVTIERVFKRRSVIVWHVLFNLVALAVVIALCAMRLQLRLVVIQLLSILLLLFYSTTLKRKLLIGNVSIGLLTALSVFSVGAYEYYFHMFRFHQYHVKLVWMYMAFAFLITLIRELVKDVEDVKGDSTAHCVTFPIKYGINASKQLIYVLTLIKMALIIITCWYFRENTVFVCYLCATVLVPSVYLIHKIKEAINAASFRYISLYVKLVTLCGILSMLFL